MGPVGAGPGQAKFFRAWISSGSAPRGVAPTKENKLKFSAGSRQPPRSFHLEDRLLQAAPQEGSCVWGAGGSSARPPIMYPDCRLGRSIEQPGELGTGPASGPGTSATAHSSVFGAALHFASCSTVEIFNTFLNKEPCIFILHWAWQIMWLVLPEGPRHHFGNVSLASAHSLFGPQFSQLQNGRTHSKLAM